MGAAQADVLSALAGQPTPGSSNPGPVGTPASTGAAGGQGNQVTPRTSAASSGDQGDSLSVQFGDLLKKSGGGAGSTVTVAAVSQTTPCASDNGQLCGGAANGDCAYRWSYSERRLYDML